MQKQKAEILGNIKDELNNLQALIDNCLRNGECSKMQVAEFHTYHFRLISHLRDLDRFVMDEKETR
jgi:hypothetical protein